ncbi:MAG: hypothetical protein H7144_13920, partial [Burkholderiales bacterium]|nr:hypothetical protein [Phycisphaerae bacterium]
MNRVPSLLVETLEDRRLLSASLKGGVLRANADSGQTNTITITLNDDKTKYNVDINGEVTSFESKRVKRIFVHGAELADTLTVDPAIRVKQTIHGYAGNDTITGGSAADALAVHKKLKHGPRGWTRLWGMGGDDTIIAFGGRNFIDGGTGNDKLTGSNGRDLISGFHGNDTINSGSGNDLVHGGDGNDVIDLGAGNDKCLAGRGEDYVLGGAGDDNIFGLNGNDSLYGGAGNDILHGILGSDSLSGGDGNDT